MNIVFNDKHFPENKSETKALNQSKRGFRARPTDPIIIFTCIIQVCFVKGTKSLILFTC